MDAGGLGRLATMQGRGAPGEVTNQTARNLERLLRPKSVAVIGGGFWCRSVVQQLQAIGFTGPIRVVHPKRPELAGVATCCTLADLPEVPDACFIGVNRHLTIDVVRRLRKMGAGGAVCFASGFLEARAESEDGADLQGALLEAAGDMPVIGPNCYGFINYLDGVLLWPDQHGGRQVDRGVALITQSSNMAINLTMQRRGLPLAYVVTAGNQAQIGLAQIGQALLADHRVTALGLHVEGIGDLRAFEALAETARQLGKPVVVLKAGRSEQARAATVSHTASLAGSAAGGQAFLARLGIGEVQSLSVLLEVLKILHVCGPLISDRIASMSCSGGEASLMADTATGRDICFPPLTDAQSARLRDALGPMVALANPLDYHTYVWTDTVAMARVFSAIMEPSLALGCVIADIPRSDRCDPSAWDCVTDAIIRSRVGTGQPMALLASLPDTMPEELAVHLMANSVVPLCGLDDALDAIAVAARLGRSAASTRPVLLPGRDRQVRLIGEQSAKAALAAAGLHIPNSTSAGNAEEAGRVAAEITFPVVLKGQGIAHKTEAGAVALNLKSVPEVVQAATAMSCDGFLVEQMLTGAVAELLIGVVRDPAHGFVLTLAAGGILTELLADSQSLLVPASRHEVSQALDALKLAPVLKGYRGREAADAEAILDAVMALQGFVESHADELEEVEVNPLICLSDRAVVADALIRME